MNSTPNLAQRPNDERYTDQAFAIWKQEHGFGDGVRLGDMPRQVLRDVLLAAQKLKSQEQGR